MEQKSMTALVSAFSRAYHSLNNKVKIFDDYMAKDILTKEEYDQIATNMAKGIGFFNPDFVGTEEEALRWIADNQLAPSPVGRAAFAERALENAVAIGARQYLILAAGYDTFGFRQPQWASKIHIFELDHPVTQEDKQMRTELLTSEKPINLHFIPTDFTKKGWITNLRTCAEFDRCQISFCSLLGISYYLTRETFAETINAIADVIPKGSSIVFDYPDQDTYTPKAGERAKRQVAMATAAKEKMQMSYSYEEIERLLADSGFLIYEHLTPGEITEQFFKKYNEANPEHRMSAFDNVNYCLAVKSKF